MVNELDRDGAGRSAVYYRVYHCNNIRAGMQCLGDSWTRPHEEDSVKRRGRPAGSVPESGSICESDRKSTRLNSSHTVISYAVFCLKKKTKPTNSYRQ